MTVVTSAVTASVSTGAKSSSSVVSVCTPVLSAVAMLSPMTSMSSGWKPSFSATAIWLIAPVAVSTSGWNIGISEVPIAVLTASPVAVNRCSESSNEAIAATASSENTSPIDSASSPRASRPSLPAAISGLSSCALLPKIAIAAASRSVGFSMRPSASIASRNTSSESRSWPLLS